MYYIFIRNIYHLFSILKIFLSIYVDSLYGNPSFALKIHMIGDNAFCTTYKMFVLSSSLKRFCKHFQPNRVQGKFEIVFAKGFQPLTTRVLQSIIWRIFLISIYSGIASIYLRWDHPFGWLARSMFRDYIKKMWIPEIHCMI